MRSTNPGMPRTVSAISVSSSYAGMTTATRLPSSTRLRLDAGPADDPRGGLPQERGDDAEQEPDQRADEHGVPPALRGRLDRRGAVHDLAGLDVLRERELGL